jgi:hypothetical protein
MLPILRERDQVWLIDLGQKTIPADFLFFCLKTRRIYGAYNETYLRRFVMKKFMRLLGAITVGLIKGLILGAILIVITEALAALFSRSN